MQKLWLKNYEFHILPGTWNTAQDLVKAGAVQSLQEVERHFWVALVAENETSYEVEVMITPNKIKAYTCECWEDGRQLMCVHIAASLFKIRQFLEQKAESRKDNQDRQQKENTGRLTVQNVLGNASQEELIAFVRSYAQGDRDFALALKTWFAGKIPHVENPYLLLLDATLPRHAGIRALRDPEIRRLRKTLDNLEKQITKAETIADARSLYQISTAILQKTAPLLGKLEESRYDQLLDYCQIALKRLLHLPQKHLSPELIENRRDFLFEFIKSAYQVPELEEALLPVLSKAAEDDAFFSRIQNLFHHTPFPASPIILQLFLASLAQQKMPKAVVRVLQDYTERPAQVKKSIMVLYHLDWQEAVLLAGEYFIDKNLFNTGQQREIENIMLAAAEKSKDRPRQMTFLRNRFRQYGSDDVLFRLKTLAGSQWPKERTVLLAELEKANDIPKTALLLSLEKDQEGLEKLLAVQKNLSILQQHEDSLLPERASFVREYYISALTGYLADHFGRQASAYVRDQLAELLRKGHAALTKEIISTLVAKFPDRQTLSKELNELFPKSIRYQALPTDTA